MKALINKTHYYISSSFTCFNKNTIYAISLMVGILFLILPIKSMAIEILQTGQSQSYYPHDDGANRYGLEWDSNTRFIDNGDGTITDSVTNLLWLKDATCLTKGTWEDSVEEIDDLNQGITGNQCQDYSADYNDWRMPNLFEMASLLSAEADINNTGYYLQRVGFVGFNNFILTSTPYSEDNSEVFCVHPANGYQIDNCARAASTYEYTAVRTLTGFATLLPATGVTSSLVDGDDGDLRQGVSLGDEARYTDNQDGTVTDNLTRLMWLKDHNCMSGTFETSPGILSTFNANPSSYPCSEYDNRRFNDWRLPTFFEMLYLQNVSWQNNNDNPFGNDFPNGIITSTVYADFNGGRSIYHVNSFDRIGLNSYIYPTYESNFIKPVRSLSPKLISSPLIPSIDNSFDSLTIEEVTTDITCGTGPHLCANQHQSDLHGADLGYRLGELERADDTFAWDINLKSSTQQEELDLNVVSVDDGEIINITETNNNGDYVLIRHTYRGSYWYSFYLHIDVFNTISLGPIDRNTSIGRLSNDITFPHLHFVIYDRYLNEHYKSVDIGSFKENPEIGGANPEEPIFSNGFE